MSFLNKMQEKYGITAKGKTDYVTEDMKELLKSQDPDPLTYRFYEKFNNRGVTLSWDGSRKSHIWSLGNRTGKIIIRVMRSGRYGGHYGYLLSTDPNPKATSFSSHGSSRTIPGDVLRYMKGRRYL